MQQVVVVYNLWIDIYFRIYPLGIDGGYFIHRFIPRFWHDFLALIGYRVYIFEGREITWIA